MFDVDFDPETQGVLEVSMDELVNMDNKDSVITNDEPASNEDSKSVDLGNNDSNELEISIDDIINLKTPDTNEIVNEDINEVIKPSSANKETTNSFLLLGNALAEEGILSEFDEEGFDKLVEETGSGGKALMHMMNNRLTEVEANIKESYDEDYKTYLQLKEAGVSSNEAFDLTNLNTQLEQIDDDILEESEDTRKNILQMHFKNTTNWSDQRIVKHIEKLVTNGEDIEEAKEALPELQKFTKDSIQLKHKEYTENQNKLKIKQEEAAKDIRDTFKADGEIIKGVKLTKIQSMKAQELLLTPIELEDGTVTNSLYAERAKNPLDFDKKLAALFAAGAFEGSVTTTKVSKKAALDALDKVLKTGSKASFKGNSPANNEVIDEQSQLINDKFMRSITNQK